MNRLAHEASPYLRQHRDNPVDWYPWGEEAFARARDADRPLLLSVGYSACHWCHVMAHESFEDPDTAAVMNELFVNVKVDREERPDVDAVYMDAVQAMSGQGGWPMTVFLAPSGEPFFAGTYFPKRSTHGRPGFVELLRAVDEAWRDKRTELLDQASRIAGAIKEKASLTSGDDAGTLSPSLLEGAYAVLRAGFDAEWGGFGGPPKFPMTSNVELLLRAHAHNRAPETLVLVTTTLDAMAEGGIYDHLGGGFSRYSVDSTWTVPHFEKMLYDQATLTRAYLHGWQVTGSPSYRQVVDETVGYVLRQLRSPEGGICSAEDADSEGVEGKFYVWSLDEVAAIGGEHAVEWYGVTAGGNFEGSNILRRPRGASLLRPDDVETARSALFEARETRVRPGLDDKVITEWNAMFVSALAEAAAALDRDDWRVAAVEVGRFLLASLRDERGRWLRSWQADAGARHLAYAVDYAWLVDAFTRLAELTGEAEWVTHARAAADDLVELFWDDDEGGVFTTGHDGERLIVRQKDTFDGASPSANSVAATALLRLGALTGDEAYTARGAAIVTLLAPMMAGHPAAFTHALGAVDLVLSGPTEIVITGDRPDLLQPVREHFLPNAVLAWGQPYDSPLWEGREPDRAYVCHDYTCQLPASDIETLLRQLG
ncbi:MAG: uncharacterized protein QOG03_1682 [Actinomycetota bacterium]|nr:uncharacterized protein [Actinomycetota bacterium]